MREIIHKHLDGAGKVILCDPLDYPDFDWAMNSSKFILSDSGGSAGGGLRDKETGPHPARSDRAPEAVEHGSGVLVGVDRDRIREAALKLLEDAEAIPR